MAQFDVHLNKGRNRASVPHFVNVQSRRLDNLRTRLVVPLLRPPGPVGGEPRMAPEFAIQSETLGLGAFELFTAPASALGPVIASRSGDAGATRIISATDEVITRAFG